MAKIKLQGEEEKRKNIYYEVDTADKPIGEGGMGKVMRGLCVDEATKVSRPVAIKFLYADLPAHAIERARREANIQLRNDNLVEMLGFIEVDSYVGNKPTKHYHVVSELLHGISLSDIFEGKCSDKSGNEIPFAKKLLKDYQTDPVHFAKNIVMNVLSGLIALHDAGYVHRDIDPSNIMLTEDEHIKLIDFGIAKQVSKLTTHDKSLTTTGVFMGKAEYAAPELVLGDLRHQNQTTDIYAMGILLYQCIVGHVPFEGPSHVVLEKQLHKNIPLRLIKERKIRKIIECATEKNQNVRYQTASQMRVALENYEGKKMEMKQSTKLFIVGGLTVTILSIAGVSFTTYRAKKVAEEKEQQRILAVDDSLCVEVSNYSKKAQENFWVGTKHDEGFESSYLKAYEDYSQAISAAKQLKNRKVDIKDISAKQEQVRKALISAKSEFEAKAKSFDADGISDVANEFRNRANNISKVLK